MSLPIESYRRFVENLGKEYFFYQHGTDGVFTYVSQSVADVLGYEPQEFLAHYASLFTDDVVNVTARNHTELSMCGIAQPRYEVEVRHKDGSARRLEVLEVPVRGPVGVQAIEGIAHDVTDRLYAEARRSRLIDELAEVNRRLSEVVREKDELLSIVAHDLQSPLTSIRGWTEAVKLLFIDPAGVPSRERLDQAGEALASVIQRCDQMSALIGRLLQAQALEQGVLSLSARPIDVAPVAASVIADCSQRAAAKHIRLSLRLPDAGSAVAIADPHALREILDNLVSNAVKYSPAGGGVAVEVRAEGPSVAVSVCDQGPGIAEAEQPRLFEKFARLSPRPTGGEASVGLGLSIVKRLVEMMGGSVFYLATASPGATFVVKLPAAPISAA